MENTQKQIYVEPVMDKQEQLIEVTEGTLIIVIGLER
jgi:hypothetical protein